MILKSHQNYIVMGERGRAGGWGVGGGGDSCLPYLAIPDPAPTFPDFIPFFITKYWPLLRNFPQFSLFSCRSLLSRLLYPSRPFLPRTSTNTWMDWLWIIYCFVSGGKGGGGGGGGGGDVWGRWCRGPNLPPPTPCLPGSLPFYLDFLPLGLLPLRNIEHYIVA